MEPMNDRDLKEMLRQWEAPAAPASLDERVLGRLKHTPNTWWHWLLRGSIRVPVPVGAAVLAVLFTAVYLAVAGFPRSSAGSPSVVRLTDFQPVAQLQMRIVRSGNENR